MATLKLFVDTQNKRLVDAFNSRATYVPPSFFLGDTGINYEVHLLTPSATNSIDRPYEYIDPTGITLDVALGLIDQEPTAGTFTLTDPAAAQTTAAIAFDVSAATFQTALRAGCPTNYSSATVTGDAGGPWTIDRVTVGVLAQLTGTGTGLSPDSFVGTILLRAGTVSYSSRQRVRLLQQPACFDSPTDPLDSAAVTIVVKQAGSASANEVQRVSINDDCYDGSFSLTSTTLGAANNETFTSGPIPYNSTDAAMQTIINAAFGTGNEVSVTQVNNWTWDVEFTGANVELTNMADMTGNASGLIVPVGLAGILTLNTATALGLVGDDASVAVTFEIQQTLAGLITTLYQNAATIVNDLIDPQSTGATELPSFYTQAQVDAIIAALHDRDAVSVSTAGTTEVTIDQYCKYFTYRVTAGAGAGTYTRNIDLPDTNRVNGDKVQVILIMAASVNPTIVIRDNAGPTTLYSETGTGSTYTRPLWFTFNGTAWESDQG